MQDLILNILFCCLYLILSSLIIIITVKSDTPRFDHRVLFGILFLLQGIFVLLSSFELTFIQQKLQYIFTLAVGNTALLAISLLVLLKKKYALITFISGTFYLVEVAFVMISTIPFDISILTYIFLTIPVVFLIVVVSIIKEQDQFYYHKGILIGGLFTLILAFGVRNFELFALIKDVNLRNQAYFGEVLLIFSGLLIVFLAIVYAHIKEIQGYNLSLNVSLASILTALGVVLSFLNPFAYFELGGFKINPFVHLINAISGVFLGPIWGVVIATFIAIIRFVVGIGTLFAFPGGIPGALVVGITAIIISLFFKEKYRIFAALSEPIGTVGIGAVISLLMGATSSLFLWVGFSLSSMLGSGLGFWILYELRKRNITINYLSHGKNVIM